MQSALLLDVVVGESAAVLQLLASEDEALLVGGDALLVLDLGLDSVDGVGGLDFKSDGLAGKGLNENLHFILRVIDCCRRHVAFWACVVISAAVAPHRRLLLHGRTSPTGFADADDDREGHPKDCARMPRSVLECGCVFVGNVFKGVVVVRDNVTCDILGGRPSTLIENLTNLLFVSKFLGALVISRR